MAMVVDISVLIRNMLPKKLKDPGSFSIPCQIGTMKFKRSLCDLGARIRLIPLLVYKKLVMGEMKPTNISLQVVDKSVKYPVGVLEDVSMRIGEFCIPVDFVIMEIEEDYQIPIFLKRPFLAMTRAIIDVQRGKLTFEIGEEMIEFILAKLVFP